LGKKFQVFGTPLASIRRNDAPAKK
jgi:hypothetical protein